MTSLPLAAPVMTGTFIIWIPACLEVRRNADGVVRKREWKSGFNGAFIWAQGNFACDCNRAAFFHEGAGDDAQDWPCGDGAFSVRLTAMDDGHLLYRDGEWP